MKALLLFAFLVPTLLFAQTSRVRTINGSPSATEALSENYQVTLTLAEKDAPALEIVVVTASTTFSVTLSEPGLTFAGTLTEGESSILVNYSLGAEAQVAGPMGGTQTRTSSVQGSVRLKLGEEVQIIRAGTRTAHLSIKKLEPAKAK